MPQGPDGKTIIIVKKVSGHGGHHGGSWKVAYADFVTSMMAFFMVLWLVNSASESTRQRIASYFRRAGVFVHGTGGPIDQGGAGILPDTFMPPDEESSQTQPNRKIYEASIDEGLKKEVFGKGERAEAEIEPEEVKAEPGGEIREDLREQHEKMEEVAKQISEIIQRDAATISGLIGKIQVSVDQRGLHLEIMDTPTASMFERGSAQILASAEEELMRIGQLLNQIPNPVDIEGHTDAVPYRGGLRDRYDNWNLSSDRANAARRVLLGSGLPENRIARVVGYAAQRPKIAADPNLPANRRISITMRYSELAATTLKDKKVVETHSVPLRGTGDETKKSEKKDAAAQNPPSPEAQEKQGLQVELSTSEPEGEAIPMQLPDEMPGKPSIIDLDAVFGRKGDVIRTR